MKRPDAAKVGPPQKGLRSDEKAMKSYPGLIEFLSDTTWDDGAARTPGSLTLFIDGGVWKGCLNDREAEASLYVTGETMEAVLKALEKRMVDPEAAEWRVWKKTGKKK